MKYISENFILNNKIAADLYHNHAAKMPIIDYHCHINPQWISDDVKFENIGEMWLSGDHYKWRAMRAAGVAEKYITGNASWYEKFEKWSETVPYTMRNPLYHWTHLELKRVFNIDDILSPITAKKIWDKCNTAIADSNFSARGIIKNFNVEVICTTDDPIDTLQYHKKIKQECNSFKVLPTWRPDKVLGICNTIEFNEYINKLEKVADTSISNLNSLIDAFRKRQDFFEENGCKLSDHGLDTFYATPYTESEIVKIFEKARCGKIVTCDESNKFKSALLYELALMDCEKGWVQQYHIGAIRNNATRMLNSIGVDTGFDAINDRSVAESGFRFFDRLYSENRLAKSILYNLNPKDNYLLAVMANTYNEHPVKGKMQYGAAWWFLDNENGIRKQIDNYSNASLLGNFIGMLTDSRSILSYPRHEYFRRILCNIIGEDVYSGKLPKSEIKFIGEMVENISYNNIKSYIGL